MRAQITKDLLHCLHDGMRTPSIYCPLHWQLLALDCDRLRQQTHRSARQKMTLSRSYSCSTFWMWMRITVSLWSGFPCFSCCRCQPKNSFVWSLCIFEMRLLRLALRIVSKNALESCGIINNFIWIEPEQLKLLRNLNWHVWIQIDWPTDEAVNNNWCGTPWP